MSLRDLLFGNAGVGPDGDAVLVHVGDETHTVAQVRDRATDIACALADAGVGAGSPVGVMLPNGADVVAALFGVWRADAAYVPLNPRLAQTEVDHVLATIQPAAVVTTAEHADRFGELPVVFPEPDGVKLRPGRAGERRLDADVALVQFTSGTTGRPKPVLLRHSSVVTLLDGVIAKLRGGRPGAGSGSGSLESGSGATPGSGAGAAQGSGSGSPMPNLIPVSLSLWAGLYNVLFALRVGAPVVLMDRFEPKTFAELVRRYGIRSTVLPPAAMTMLTDDPDVESLEPLRFVRSITAPLSPLQARRFKDRFGVTLLNCYGQTEIGGEIVGWNAADARAHGEDKLGSVGRPHAGVALRVVDHNGTVLPANQPGELLVRTPTMVAGYADGTDLSDRLTPDGWFRTGDVARIDPDGFVWIEGRVSDMINRGGLKVFPAEVEEVLRLDPAVADAAVVGVPDDRLGEVPWAFVVADGDRPLDPAALDALCRQHLAPYKVPVRFEPVAELPRNEVGKVLKGALAERAVAGRP
ncbi:MAG TPA: class I adenylate-forming enzyme family protein [Acidimicrobiales bacterium]